jgi:hypothetical protein
MNQAIHRLRLFLCFFSGEDDFIIRKCNSRIQISFALIGIFVIMVFAGCWISASLFISHIFEGSRWISIPIGIIWALLVTNLYLLLLYTISPALLPVAVKKKTIVNGKQKKIILEKYPKQKSPFQSFSFLFRISLITFLAILIAQPLNVKLLAPSYREADRFAATIKEILGHNPLSWLITLFNCLIFFLPFYFKFEVRNISKNSFKDDFEGQHAQKGIKHLREQLANPTDFQNLSQQILSTNINSIKTSDFYFQKSLIEHRIILEEYEHFKKIYCLILIEKNKEYNGKCLQNIILLLNRLEKISPEKHQLWYNVVFKDLQEEKMQWYEYWANPPFRTRHRTVNRKFATEAELLQTFYQQNN